MKHWIVQTNSGGREIQQLLAALTDTTTPHSKVSMRPFTHEIQHLPKGYKNLPLALYGTISFIEWG